jgi:hypothetical protein
MVFNVNEFVNCQRQLALSLIYHLIEAENLRVGLGGKADAKKYYPERSEGVEIFLAALRMALTAEEV